ncbi:MAG: tryptophan--tRNA ligase [Candidatus Woesearchaeota archaeon]
MANFTVTPWEVKGEIDYDKLIHQFGTQKIDDKLKKRLEKYGKLNVMFRRNFYYSHRDLNLVLDDYDKKKGFFLYTGRAPSGPMHVGHLMSFHITKWFQDNFVVNVYIQIPDEEKFLFKKDLSLKDIDKWTSDNILHIIAVGFDPDKTFIFQNREFISHLFDPALLIAKKTTYSTGKAVFGFTNETNIGAIFYPALQIVPTLFEKKRCLIPCAIDQDPYWRIQRDIAESLGYSKTAVIHSKFLSPLAGLGKMSTSEESTAIWLSDSPSAIKQKVMKYAFSGGRTTVEEHRKLGGNPDIDVSFQWLSAFFEENDDKVKEIYNDYKKGHLLTGELKQLLVNNLSKFLTEHQKRKQKAQSLLDKFKYQGKLAKSMWKWRFE